MRAGRDERHVDLITLLLWPDSLVPGQPETNCRREQSGVHLTEKGWLSPPVFHRKPTFGILASSRPAIVPVLWTAELWDND